ncbi:unnamed protein product [Vitrella brassicaformis CCMP3155]|uniref:Uncharacterized protein n=2 Tax=Vitrella brassicaformis TaxID=1169539 RepID=A0A0G4EYR7_VITBC|nr:unnamed protein product [Vitrella brassicaformis CCMP3155]|eukprot:CEM03600.1 unnamed protein product [Vitrella brassicaformis CCMP3155]
MHLARPTPPASVPPAAEIEESSESEPWTGGSVPGPNGEDDIDDDETEEEEEMSVQDEEDEELERDLRAIAAKKQTPIDVSKQQFGANMYEFNKDIDVPPDAERENPSMEEDEVFPYVSKRMDPLLTLRTYDVTVVPWDVFLQSGSSQWLRDAEEQGTRQESFYPMCCVCSSAAKAEDIDLPNTRCIKVGPYIPPPPSGPRPRMFGQTDCLVVFDKQDHLWAIFYGSVDDELDPQHEIPGVRVAERSACERVEQCNKKNVHLAVRKAESGVWTKCSKSDPPGSCGLCSGKELPSHMGFIRCEEVDEPLLEILRHGSNMGLTPEVGDLAAVRYSLVRENIYVLTQFDEHMLHRTS